MQMVQLAAAMLSPSLQLVALLYSLTFFSSGCENSEIAAQPQSIAVVKCFIHIIVAHVLHFVQPSYYTINLTIALVCYALPQATCCRRTFPRDGRVNCGCFDEACSF